ncbi:hypothetical protein CROQUDRAFT_73739 [Cronartium quercuum f. sp. fusiforme G11]|uniref:Heparinase II/III family protein n=1 Tax=Cronartium quercuum f. sp. fusiforme G11 TaxID=708437 RepID=A0A9P6NPV9_9BASI|nr:hypothetical protein CROQUDRAFT_73739 [Cronartium quercuum f. sp. fusiforme G11]
MYGRNQSMDSQSRPLGKIDYIRADDGDPSKDSPNPDLQHEAFTNEKRKPAKRTSPWLKFGLPIAILLIIAAIIGAILGSRSHSNSTTTAGRSAASSGSATGAGASAGRDASQMLFTGYNAYGVPQYPSSANSVFNAPPSLSSNANLAWGKDPNAPDENGQTIRSGHPRLFASSYRWGRLPALIQQDPYMASWNATIFANATAFYNAPPTNYSIDGGYTGSGVLDVGREVQLRLKHWGYAYRMSNDTKWVDRAWRELQVAAGNTTQPFGRTGNNWNTDHWLDVAEFTIGFAIAYDWMYDAWTADQRTAIMWSIITLGLQKGVESHANNAWFLTTNGNWNCVTNGGMVVGSLAIMNEDPTGTAAKLLPLALQSASTNCVNAVSSDGTWSETSDYWYFGSQGHAHMASAMLTASGSTQQLLSANPSFNLTGLYHMFVYGNTYKANTGDCGPNKYVASANPLLFYGDQFNVPRYTLYQRDRADAADPLSMFWYNPQTTGGWYVGLPLDHSFSDPSDAWVSMRSSWTNTDGLFVSVKSGNLTGHQTHGFLDAGTFTLDALGERWAGHLCQNDYLGAGYFSSEGSGSQRWLYYRCRTEGQNTILMNGLNQNPASSNTVASYGTTAEAQDNINFDIKSGTSTAYWITDLTSAYNGTAVARGVRLLNGRTQVLLQDEIGAAAAASQWRMHTNATIDISSDGKTANLQLNGKKLVASLLSPSSATFSKVDPVRLTTDPPLPSGSPDLPNPGVTVLAAAIPAGTQTVSVLFTPQWGNGFNAVNSPKEVPLASWSLTSHS